MKIQIKSLHIVDCGPIKDAVFHFDDENGVPRDTTLMTGANGSGKTTILRLIVALAQSLAEREGPHREFLARARKVSMEFLVDDEVFSVDSGSERIGDLARGIDKNDYPSVTTLSRHTFTHTVAQQSAQSPFYTFISQEASAENSSHLVPSILFFPHHRELPDIDGRSIEQENVSYQWVYEYEARHEYKGSLNSYLIWLDYAHPDQFSAAQEVMNSLYADKKRFEINRPRLKVIVRTRDGGAHDLEELSSGEQNILIMLIELRRRLIPGSIVLIDEIENSLHQDYQFRFGFAIQALQKQIPFQLIATSHVNTFSRIFGYENLLVLPAPGTYGRQRQAPVK